MAKNIVAVLRGELPKDYRHDNLGAVAGLGLGYGAFQSGKFAVTGVIAWGMHRGYHGLAVPTWERKIRVFGNWAFNLVLGRDIVGISARENPRAYFAEFASRPKAAPAPVAEPVAAVTPTLPTPDKAPDAPVYSNPQQ